MCSQSHISAGGKEPHACACLYDLRAAIFMIRASGPITPTLSFRCWNLGANLPTAQSCSNGGGTASARGGDCQIDSRTGARVPDRGLSTCAIVHQKTGSHQPKVKL